MIFLTSFSLIAQTQLCTSSYFGGEKGMNMKELLENSQPNSLVFHNLKQEKSKITSASDNIPKLISPREENYVSFGEVELGKTIQVKIWVKGFNLVGDLSVSNSGSEFYLSQRKLSKDSVLSDNGCLLEVTYRPISIGSHHGRLMIMDGGLTAAHSVSLNGICIGNNDNPRVDSINLSEHQMCVEKFSEAKAINAIISPNSAMTNVIWTSSNPYVARTDCSGTACSIWPVYVIPLNPGETILTATTTDGSDLSASCHVTVLPTLVSSLKLNTSSISLHPNDEFQLTTTISPSDADNKELAWSSNDTIIADVDSTGMVKAKKTGTAIITARTKDGSDISASCMVNVYPIYISSINLNYTDVIMYANDNIHLIATIFPNNASIKDLEWSSSDYSIASVDQNGNVHAVGDGTATITAYSTDGSGKFASCTVTVRSYVESLSLNQCTASLYPNESIQLEAQILPNYAYNQTLRWNSSNTSVATVSSEGLVICKNPGFATIIAATTDGSNLNASCDLTVLTDYKIEASDNVHIRGNTQCISPYSIELINNKSSISAIQFDMTLPTFLHMNISDGYPDVWLDETRKTRTHTVEVNNIGTNMYRFIVTSSTNRDLNGNNGDFVHMNLVFDTIHPSGNYYINLSNIVLTESNETEHRLNNVSSLVKLQYLLGDANADTTVDVADYVATAARILNKPTPVFYQDAANVNADGNLNVTDLVGITNIALGIRPIEIKPSPGIDCDEMNDIPKISCFTTKDNAQLCVVLNNLQAIAGMQMDLCLSEGMSVKSAELVGRAANQQLGFTTLSNGRARLLISSFSDNDIATGDGDILVLYLQGVTSHATATLDGIIAVERDLSTHEIEAMNVPLDASGVDSVLSYDQVKIYSDSHQIVIESPSRGIAQLVQINGMTRHIDIKPGCNYYPAQPGYYIVRMNGQIAKIAL